MGTRFHPNFYDDAMLKTLDCAFKDLCQKLQINGAATEAEERLKTTALAELGMNDAAELSEQVLESLRH